LEINRLKNLINAALQLTILKFRLHRPYLDTVHTQHTRTMSDLLLISYDYYYCHISVLSTKQAFTIETVEM